MNRRDFLKGCAGYAAVAAVRGFGVTNLAFAPPAVAGEGVQGRDPHTLPPNNRDLLVLVFVRGGLDGLNLVVPFNKSPADRSRYYDLLRPTLHIPAPNDATAPRRAIDLDGQFALHPDAARGIAAADAGLPATGAGSKGSFDTGGLCQIFRNGDLAIVDAVGSPDVTGSHFDTELYVDLGGKTQTSGWITRYLDAIGEPADALAVAPQWGIPPSLFSPAGRSAIAIPDSDRFGPVWQTNGWVSQSVHEAITGAQMTLLSAMYQRGNPAPGFVEAIGQSALRSYDAIQPVLATPYDPAAEYLTDTAYVADYGGLGNAMRTIAQLAKASLANPLRVACVDVGGGYDTHDQQGTCLWAGDGSGNPRYPRLIANLSTNLKAFYDDMNAEPQWRGRFVVAVVSEFGRVLYQNNSSGTDHGSGNVMLVLGSGKPFGVPNINGGRIFGEWPGLTHLGFNDGLQITTDYRVALADILMRRMGLTMDQVNAQVFPALNLSAGRLLNLAVQRS